MISKRAYAKINLGLDVTGKRDDGYHIVRMIMQNVDIYDTLTFEKTYGGEIHLKFSGGDVPESSDNLIWKVCSLLKEKYNIADGVTINLEKNIPIAAGMAGGSADAAATFYGMNELFDLNMNQDEMCKMAVDLGADIPYCIMGGTMLSEGIGEVLTKLPDFPKCYIVVGKPEVGVSTGWVYKSLDALSGYEHPDIDGICDSIKSSDLNGVCNRLLNVLEGVTAPKYDIIGKIENVMEDNGAIKAIMTGSGPTVFGIYDNEDLAKGAYEALEKENLCKQLFITKPINPQYK